MNDLSTKLEVVSVSDVGRRRPHNEDSCASDAGIGLGIIADGMGGYKAGEVASAIAVTSIVNQVKNGLLQLKSEPSNGSTDFSQESILVRDAIIRANAIIVKKSKSSTQFEGMGTTVCLILFYDNRYTAANVGDSRLYRMRDDRFEQLTSDHSLAQELIDRGLFTPEEAAVHTPKNLVTRALGIDETVEVDLLEDKALPGDIYLLCTDGLNDMLDDEEIHLTLRRYSANLSRAAEELVSMANGNGGYDNISVLLVRPTARFPANPAWYSKLASWK